MMAWLRRFLSSWVALGILGLVVVAFIITGVGTGTDPLGGMGGGANVTLAKVGNTKLESTAVEEQIQRVLRNARQQNPQIDMAAFLRSNGFEQVMDQMINSQAAEAWGRKHGFAAARLLVDAEIASIPAFQVAGRFDQTTYANALQQQRLNDRTLRQGLEGDIIRRQLLVPVAAGAESSEGMARPYAALLIERRVGRIGFIASANLRPQTPPTEQQLRTYYDANKSRYLTPETRSFHYALFGPATLGAGAQPTDAEIERFYAANAATYAAQEKRTLSQAVLPDEAAAKALVADVRAGKSFAAAAAARGFGAADLAVGERTREAFASETSPAVATAAFSVGQGEIAGPAQSPFGWHVVHVDTVVGTAARPLAAVRSEIAAELSAQKTEEALGALVAKIEDAIANGTAFSDVAKDNGLTVVEVPAVTSEGVNPANAAYQLPGEAGTLLPAVFQSDAESEATVETLPNGAYALLDLDTVNQAAVAAFQTVSAKVAEDYANQIANDKAKAIADDIIAKVKAGGDITRLFAEAKLPPTEEVRGSRIQIAQNPTPVAEPVRLVFSLPTNGVRALAAPGGAGWFVVKVDNIEPGSPAELAALLPGTREQFGGVLGEEYAAQFIRALREDVGVTVNEKAIAAMKARLANPQ